MNEQIPTIGRCVHYRLSAEDVKTIEERRKAAYSDLTGNPVQVGMTFPMTIVKTWGDTPGAAVNGKVQLDGFDDLWVTSVTVGEGPRTFSWPTRT